MKSMKELSADDVSILALIAENPRISNPEFVDLLGKLSRDAQLIAHMIVKLETGTGVVSRSHSVSDAARSILDWVRTNKKIKKRPVVAGVPAE